MKPSSVCLVLASFSLAAIGAIAQAPRDAAPAPAPTASTASAPAAPAVATPQAESPAALPSALIRPSLGSVQGTLSGLQLDKWKRGSVRDEAADEIKAVQHEIRVNLPPLMNAADAAPESLGKSLPVVKHLGAVYDVLLRIYDASRISAPSEQVGQLQLVLRSLERSRLTLDDRLQSEAFQQEQQISALRVTVDKQAAFKCPAPPPVKPCPKPRVHHYTHRRPKEKPAEKKPDSTTKPLTNQ